MKKYVFGFLLVIAISGCDDWKECTEKHISDTASPDGNYVASHFVRNCGATTPSAYHINLRKGTDKFPVSLSGTIIEGEVFNIASQKLTVEWKDDKTLLVKCMNCLPGVRYKMEKTWQDVNVDFDISANKK
jgi:hypothetical protein